ncbi:hypothetical protein D9756_009991 [Leucocoprinus leucothites]|uniref:Hydrophobic surface binding protein n=1 Tax=Leucocoprinus leucothites TaxID=201217 RepID=A0A8H5CSY8_9AGAR|nr:hypothetical protein D9756_009991 [Leucoagaricus leucothites]
MQLKSITAFLSVITVALGATVQNVLDDIAAAKAQAVTLENAIDSFPTTGGSLAQALAIHQQALNTVSALNKTTSDVETVPLPVSEADAASILDAVIDAKPVIENGLTDIVTKKSAIDALPISGLSALVEQDLKALNTSTLALGDDLIARAPADLLDEATSLRAEIAAAFVTAIAAYA